MNLDAHCIAPKLYQGSMPPMGTALRDAGFDVLANGLPTLGRSMRRSDTKESSWRAQQSFVCQAPRELARTTETPTWYNFRDEDAMNRARGVYGMVGGLRALRVNARVGVLPPGQLPPSPPPIPPAQASALQQAQQAVSGATVALAQANAAMQSAGGIDPTGILQNAIDQATAALAQANANLAAAQQGGGGTLGPPPGGGGSTPAPAVSPWTTPLLLVGLAAAVGTIVVVYEKPGHGKRAFA